MIENGKEPHLQDIQNLRDEIELLATRWLNNHGWNHVSPSPVCCWFWEKEVEGVTYRLSAHDAMELEARLCGCPECGSDEIYFENPRTGCGSRACQDCGYEFPKEPT